MYSCNISPCRRILLWSYMLCINLPMITPTVSSIKLNITIKTPNNTSTQTYIPYKPVHVKGIIPIHKDPWIIVGFQPVIQTHYKVIEQVTVHLCDSLIDETIWYDDEAACGEAQSMLIYEWTPSSSVAPFHIPDDYGFEIKPSTSLVLTVIYNNRKRRHKEQSGIVLFLSTQLPRFRMGTMLVGDKQQGTHFSCRSSSSPRLLYAMKKLNSMENKTWWRMHIIRIRQFGRKVVESVLDSKAISNNSQTHIERVSHDLFLMKGDYLLTECENKSQASCYFLLYYVHKSDLNKNDNVCRDDHFGSLFNLLPLREIPSRNQTTTDSFMISSSTIIMLICVLLLVTWISIIIGCIIMRHVRGLVNFRTEPTSQSLSGKNKLASGRLRAPHDNYQQRSGDADQIMQIDAEHG